MKLLPSQRQWVQAVCEYLIDGEIVIVRGIPGSGKTTLLNAVARELGDTSVSTWGRSYTEQDQDTRGADFQKGVREALDRHGTAHLLFDDYPHALRRSHGLRLQRQLLHLLVDGEGAVDIGALLTGRWARSMHLVSSGSPLVARARVMPLPRTAETDFKAVGYTQSVDAVVAVGGNTALLGMVTSVLGRPALHQVCEAAELRAPDWVKDVPWDAVQWIKEVVRDGPATLPPDDFAAEALAPLVFSASDGRYDVVSALRSSAALAELDGRAPTWPDRWVESVATFCGLLSGAPAVLWVDRYLAVDPPTLLRFMQDVRATCGTQIRMLIAKDKAQRVDASVAAALTALDCEIKTMHPGDRKQLHDRHLIFLGGGQGGVVMPTGGVVLCKDPPGSAMAVQARLLDQNLIRGAWDRGCLLGTL
ncbi:ATP-binding protein [Streptomyces paludis]|uniref:AAA family ATPase n=1 Tax=Streptomyces paludis TaxID=2282738 RepID=A0A345HRA5_9ACTN|nr:ATP-binding protein [Streptomyces paludis]AXG79229.1 AAA family ATPase [Streptomyces paludis]